MASPLVGQGESKGWTIMKMATFQILGPRGLRRERKLGSRLGRGVPRLGAAAPAQDMPRPYTGARDRSIPHPLAKGGSPVASKIVFSPKLPAALLDTARGLVPAGFEMVVVDAGTPEFKAALPDAQYYEGFP